MIFSIFILAFVSVIVNYFLRLALLFLLYRVIWATISLGSPHRKYYKFYIKIDIKEIKYMKQHRRLSAGITVCYFGLYIIIALSLLIRQPFGSPPDEANRLTIPRYIMEHNSLPNGYDESIRINSYGFSYAFQPILPYMIQGWAMRLFSGFADSWADLFYIARSVNFLFGLVMAFFVLLLGREWFHDRRFAWLFSFLITFIPQAIFMHSYVNTDSCCLMSTAIMLYGLTRGLKDGFSWSSSIIMSVGIIFCALSYYNAYGYILSCILLFIAYFLTRRAGKLHFDVKRFLKMGCFISVLVLLGISWWFIRSAILYDGDFLGLRARDHCASLYAVPEVNPNTRKTWQNQGYTVFQMLKQTTFWELSILSFIGVFGSMSITTSIWVYRFYRLLFTGGVILSVVIPLKDTILKKIFFSARKGLEIFFHANMVFCILMPLILSIWYSYATDYQPQGRYLLPSLVPLGYYSVRGIEKVMGMKVWEKVGHKWKRLSMMPIVTVCVTVLTVLIIACILVTVYGYVFVYYATNPKGL